MVGVGFCALTIWAEMDIAGAPLRSQRAAYNAVWYLALFGFVVILGVAYRSMALPLGVLLWSSNGGEDTLYYWLQLRAVPSRLPWLDGHMLVWQPPTDVSVIAGFVAGLVVLIGAVVLEDFIVQRHQRSRRLEHRAARPAETDYGDSVTTAGDRGGSAGRRTASSGVPRPRAGCRVRPGLSVDGRSTPFPGRGEL